MFKETEIFSHQNVRDFATLQHLVKQAENCLARNPGSYVYELLMDWPEVEIQVCWPRPYTEEERKAIRNQLLKRKADHEQHLQKVDAELLELEK